MSTLVIDASVWVSAADQTDRFSSDSRMFLTVAAEESVPIALHAFAAVEIACALGRRLRDAGQAKALTAQLLQSPLIESHPMSAALLDWAVDVGTRESLRAGDAVYAALSEMIGGEVVSWDDDLVTRSGAVTPLEWAKRRAAGK